MGDSTSAVHYPLCHRLLQEFQKLDSLQTYYKYINCTKYIQFFILTPIFFCSFDIQSHVQVKQKFTFYLNWFNCMYCIYCLRFSGVQKSSVYISSVETNLTIEIEIPLKYVVHTYSYFL